jgi:ABC-2 type transport system ATP-binding protein
LPAVGIIEVADLRKSYGDLKAVDGVTLDVAAGEFFGILGPNGAGKTTTLEIIEGLREPDSGTVSVLGMSPWPRNEQLTRRMGVQLQASSFFERLTAREQLHTFAALYDTPAGRADEVLELVGLTDKLNTRTEKLSGGQKQRLSIACAIVHDPELLYLDEPSGPLDPQARHNLWDVLRTINESGRTVILTTHSMDEAEQLCDRVAIMDHGRVLEVDTPRQFVRNLDVPTRITVDRRALTEKAARSIQGVETVVADDDGLVLHTKSPAQVLARLAALSALDGLQVRGATLEDVFLSLTGREYRE